MGRVLLVVEDKPLTNFETNINTRYLKRQARWMVPIERRKRENEGFNYLFLAETGRRTLDDTNPSGSDELDADAIMCVNASGVS